ncbi:MAG: methionyl-tRNA formyltransferase [Candidatus Omnitrophica bacterium]|nr:methionyl-tRNA formyltransferase [Candidatus Omnitrophota bacterium]
MRIVFVGTVAFSRHCLLELLRQPWDIAAVLTLDPEYAERHADYADLSEVTSPRGIPLIRVRDINHPETVRQIRSLRPDLICVFGWSQVIGRAVLDIPPKGCLGSHPTLLPQHRGHHPIIWALVEGLQESGLTFFYLDEGIDSGDLLWQRPFPITLEDGAASVYRKVEQLASQALAELLPQVAQGCAPRIPQDHRQATYWRRRNEQDGVIRWELPTLQTYNLIRALSRPYVGAQTSLHGANVVMWRSRLPAEPLSPHDMTSPPGTVLSRRNDELLVRTGDGYLRVIHYEIVGEVPLPREAQFGMSS